MRFAVRLLLLAISTYIVSSNSTEVEDCWSLWSPCTVTCIPHADDPKHIDFAQQWRIWQDIRCLNTAKPPQHTEFRPCPFKVPHCLQKEKGLPLLSSRTVFRVFAIFLALLMSFIPTICICCRYTAGHPLICCRRRNSREKPMAPEGRGDITG